MRSFYTMVYLLNQVINHFLKFLDCQLTIVLCFIVICQVFFKYKKPYESLIPIKDRLYDFSFVGRLDRPGRTELIRELNRNFSNVYLHDSSNEYLTSDNLNFIIQNTRFLINLTSVQSKNSYGFKKFPEYLQLQEKSRI